jgi:cyclic pyranopterin phosphate synthase
MKLFNIIYIKKAFLTSKLTHTGNNKMVNIGNKDVTFRYARARCNIITTEELLIEVKNNSIAKGDVLRVAEIAGIMASKQTSNLIPLCHQINLNTCKVDIKIVENGFVIESYVESHSKTGVEMEALIACQISAATIYDMCKAYDKSIVITNLKVIEKFGGKSGHFINNI